MSTEIEINASITPEDAMQEFLEFFRSQFGCDPYYAEEGTVCLFVFSHCDAQVVRAEIERLGETFSEEHDDDDDD